ncbi:MAG: PilN domain-containing protein [Candidatus Omnitrophica bacterium]|nr:PilN domain-containing protein [Candidatus Omnitrophota bacterium]
MIKINLLPEEFIPKPQKIVFKPNSKHILYVVAFIFGIMVFIHIYLIAVFIFKNTQLNALNSKWQTLAAQRKMVEDFKKEYEVLSTETISLQQLDSLRINWAEKLNKLSLLLPHGVWLNELSLKEKNFILKGSVISLQKEELTLINKFMNNLKTDLAFFKHFVSLELGPLQRKTLGGYDIVDFVLQAKLK